MRIHRAQALAGLGRRDEAIAELDRILEGLGAKGAEGAPAATRAKSLRDEIAAAAASAG